MAAMSRDCTENTAHWTAGGCWRTSARSGVGGGGRAEVKSGVGCGGLGSAACKLEACPQNAWDS